MKSMTGFGSGTAGQGDTVFNIDIRSVNQRHLDVKIQGSREFGQWESEIRREVSSAISRGRVELNVSRSVGAKRVEVALNKAAAKAYVRAWKELKREYKLAGEVDLQLLQGRPEIFVTEAIRSNPNAEYKIFQKALRRALDAHTKNREKEGRHLRSDMSARVKTLVKIRKSIGSHRKGASTRIKNRIDTRMRELLADANIDKQRLAQEAALLADKSDVTEEVVRLDAHLGSLAGLVAAKDPVGKRIEFLLQEIVRELNTIGSKCGELEVTNLVMQGKAEVEKLREQVQNVE